MQLHSARCTKLIPLHSPFHSKNIPESRSAKPCKTTKRANSAFAHHNYITDHKCFALKKKKKKKKTKKQKMKKTLKKQLICDLAN